MKLEKLNVGRHLRDENSIGLKSFDGPLTKNQEAAATEMSKEIVSAASIEGSRAIFLISSPRKRAVQTTELIRQSLSHLAPNLKLRVSIDHSIRELDQGELILPKDLDQTEFFKPLQRAWEIFWEESFGENDNQLYNFGDPIFRDGELVHKDISSFFKEYGESYRDLALRLYSSVLELGKNLSRFEDTKPVVITHGSPLAIFRELELIGEKLLSEGTTFQTGNLMRMTWDNFISRDETRKHPEFGEMSYLSLNALHEPGILLKLEQEVQYLKGMEG